MLSSSLRTQKNLIERGRLIIGEPDEFNIERGDLCHPYQRGSSSRFLDSFIGQKLLRLFLLAGYDIERQRSLVRRIVALSSVIFLFTLLSKPFLLFPFILLYICLEYILLRSASIRRAERFERDYTALLLSLASAVRTGQDPLVALCEADRLFLASSEVTFEIRELKANIERGFTEEEAIQLFGHSISHPDIQMFHAAFILSRKHGASLAPSLQRLAKVTRQRQSFRRKARAALAMQRLSSLGIAGCAVVIAAMQAAANPEAFRNAIHHPFGMKALLAGTFLMVSGVVWMTVMTKKRM